MVKTQLAPKKIFYVDQGDFLRKTMELILKQKGLEVYTVETMENNLYLLDDLQPDIIIFDVLTVGEHLESLHSGGLKIGAAFIGVGEEADRQAVSGVVDLFLSKPLEAKTLAQTILSVKK